MSLLFGLSALGAPAKPCDSPDHRAFDFWLGEWRVETPDGKLAGHNSITRGYDGCVIEERWRGESGSNGTSLNIYDASTKQWHQTWVDNSGLLLQISGQYADGRMQMSGKRTENGKPMHDRITWSRIEGDRVRQLWEQSPDGKTWTVAFEGIYIRGK